MAVIWLLLIGVFAGVAGGLFGVGGGLVMVPLLSAFWGLNQHQAQGTSLAVILLPTALPAVLLYWQKGHIGVSIVAWVAAGFLLGGLLGGAFAQDLPDQTLKRVFGCFLLLVSLKIIFFK